MNSCVGNVMVLVMLMLCKTYVVTLLFHIHCKHRPYIINSLSRGRRHQVKIVMSSYSPVLACVFGRFRVGFVHFTWSANSCVSSNSLNDSSYSLNDISSARQRQFLPRKLPALPVRLQYVLWQLPQKCDVNKWRSMYWSEWEMRDYCLPFAKLSL